MSLPNGRSVSFNASEAAALFLVLKAREGTLDRLSGEVLAKLEKFLYDALSIEEMESLVREASR